ncbi:uncharacterized protein LOC123534713 [Mercenaria mercenaria]|uniref:uncharacterized protein LOC123534713 n=1 Tax=Mercenaria mercenaria TaxID=6596 RepID=UPI00234F9BEE|nr:uncharacterized protein LOC123534713 [Mercenaria mercenaria]
MADQEEVVYDDTLTEDDTKDDQHRREQSSDTGSKPAGSTEVVETMPRTKPPPVAPKPKHIQETLDRKGCSAINADSQMLSTPGWYYFDGKNLSIQRPEAVYTPGSDYCHVLMAKNADDDSDNSDSSLESDSSGSENANEDVQVRSKLSGLKTLNINIRLNVADLVQTSASSRRHRHKRTRHKTVRRVPPTNYEIVNINNESTDTGKEPVENSMKSIGVETDVFELPPRRPPKTYRTEVNESDAGQSSKNDSTVEEENYEFMASVEPAAANKNRNVKRHSSEPALSSAHAHSSEEIYGYKEDYYSQISGLNAPDSDVYSSDTQIKTEVKDLSGTQEWFYTYKERHKAETNLSKDEKADGSFAVISENIEENHHFPFTLLLKHRGKITRTPIKRITDFRRKKYELFNTKKDTILKLVEHFRLKPLPHFKLTLR